MLKYSVVILNWKRPKNIKIILDNMVKFKSIQEIIISNGLKETAVTYVHDKVKIHDDYDKLNQIYGLDLRFTNVLKCNCDHVVILDDDKTLDESEMEKLLTEYEKDTSRVVGWCGRNLVYNKTDDLSYLPNDCYGNVDILLTQLIVFQKKYANLFFLCKPLVEHIYKTGVPYGNGEDIFLSFIVSLYTGKNNFALSGVGVRPLQADHAISTAPYHLTYRTKLCNFLYKNKPIFLYVLKNIKL
jgi:hypothetical protein